MAFGYLLICLYIGFYCTLPARSDTSSDIVYEFQEKYPQWDLMSKNNITEPLGEYYDTFLWDEFRGMKIVVHFKRSSNRNYHVLLWKLNQNFKAVCNYNFNCTRQKCTFEINKNSGFNVYWSICIYDTSLSNPISSKYINFHNRLLSNNTLIKLSGGQIIPIQIANHNIKDFDAFACLVFNGRKTVDLMCDLGMDKYSTNLYKIKNMIRWRLDINHAYPNNYNIKLQDGNVYDCIQKNKGDFVIARIYLINNESGTKNATDLKSVSKPVSTDDIDGCNKYVNCLYDSNYCSMDEESENLILWLIGVAAFIIILIIVAAYFIMKYLKRNKISREYSVHYVDDTQRKENAVDIINSDNVSSPVAQEEEESNDTNVQDEVLVDNELYITTEQVGHLYATITGFSKNGKNVIF